MKLTFSDHDRRRGAMTYVYPVLSRRARAVSVGVNLNPNQACNWRCVYCQVPGLVRGVAPTIDLALLEDELGRMLALVRDDEVMREVPEDCRRVNDVAFSGDGEATTSEQFAEAVEVAHRVLVSNGLREEVKLLLITNGSMTHLPDVQRGLERMARGPAEVWFKLDGGTRAGRKAIADVALEDERVLANLTATAERCPTWIQTCVFARRGAAPEEAELAAYLALLRAARERGIPLRGVHLYGLARPSHQPEAGELEALPSAWLQELARRIEAAGLPCKVAE